MGSGFCLSAHDFNQFLGGNIGNAGGENVLTGLHDHNAVADAVDFIQLVGDVNDGDSLLAEFFHVGMELIDAVCREGSCGFIQYEQLQSVGGDGPCNLNHLPLGKLQLAQGCFDVDVVMGENCLQCFRSKGFRPFAPSVTPQGRMVHVADGEVFICVEIAAQRQLLICAGDTPPLGLVGRILLGVDGFAAQADRSGRGRIYAGNDLHQGGFSRAVGADNPHDLTRADGKIHFIERNRVPENHGDFL